MDLLVNRWWLEALVNPGKSGLLNNCFAKEHFKPQLEMIAKILGAIFLNKEFGGNPLKVRNFISSKRYFSPHGRKIKDEYLRKLLDIRLPSLESRRKGDLLSMESMCISLESLNIVLRVLFDNLESVSALNASYAKYVERANSFTVLEDSSGAQTSLFQPTASSFLYEPVNFSSSLTDKEFQESLHYVLFQKVAAAKLESEKVKEEVWHRSLNQLLARVDIGSYHCPHSANKLLRLLHEIYKSPMKFSIRPEDSEHAKIIAYYLINHLKSVDEQAIIKELMPLHNNYKEANRQIQAKFQQTETVLKATISTLKNVALRVQEQCKQIENDVVYCELAREVISQYRTAYQIKKPLGDQASLIHVFGGKVAAGDFTIEFPVKPSKDQTTINKFLCDYRKLQSGSNCVAAGKNRKGVCDVFKSYFKEVKKFIYTKWDRTRDLEERDKRGVFDRVYSYSMLLLHSYVFPCSPSERDANLLRRARKLQTLTLDQLEIKPGNRRVQLWDFCITR